MKTVKLVTNVASATYVPSDLPNGYVFVGAIDALQATSAILYVDVSEFAGTPTAAQHFWLVPVVGAQVQNWMGIDGIQIANTLSDGQEEPPTNDIILSGTGTVPGDKYSLAIDFGGLTSITVAFKVVLT